jgi:hypothetical protein
MTDLKIKLYTHGKNINILDPTEFLLLYGTDLPKFILVILKLKI